MQKFFCNVSTTVLQPSLLSKLVLFIYIMLLLFTCILVCVCCNMSVFVFKMCLAVSLSVTQYPLSGVHKCGHESSVTNGTYFWNDVVRNNGIRRTVPGTNSEYQVSLHTAQECTMQSHANYMQLQISTRNACGEAVKYAIYTNAVYHL